MNDLFPWTTSNDYNPPLFREEAGLAPTFSTPLH